MQNWRTESEYKKAIESAKKIFADWPSDDSDMDDSWVGVTIGQKEFDLNVWFDSKAVSWAINIKKIKINDLGQLETIGVEFIRLLTDSEYKGA